jgi:pSer/pThr/pTyr-binding forkhead associated (FHA) protein
MDKTRQTAILEEQDTHIRESMLKQSTRELGTGTLGVSREILILIHNRVERVILAEESHCLLGRFENRPAPRSNFLDLSRYDSQTRAVSRIHAQLHMDSNQVYITDLDSTNGSFVNEKRIPAHSAVKLRSGDELMLGKLRVIVMFS